MAASVRVDTPPEQGAPDQIRGPVVALAIVGSAKVFTLAPEQQVFHIGREGEGNDVGLSEQAVSRRHALMARKNHKLCILDQGSTNGTYCRGQLDLDFEVAAGDTFSISRQVRLIALDRHLLSLRRRLLWILGLRAYEAADAALLAIADDSPLLLAGPSGCDQVLLARDLHQRSSRRGHHFVVLDAASPGVEAMHAAANGTAFIDLHGRKARLDGLEDLFSKSRPIFAADDEASALAVLGSYLYRCAPIVITPPGERPDDVPSLLDALFLEDHIRSGGQGTPPTVAKLGEVNVNALKGYPWRTFDDLRKDAQRLYALVTNGFGVRAAARALGLRTPSSLLEPIQRLGLQLKLHDTSDPEVPFDPAPPPPGAKTPS